MQNDKKISANIIQPGAYASPDTHLPRIAWTPESTDLHVNLVALGANEEIGEHVNESLDVLLTCLTGDGEIRVDADVIPLTAGTVILIPMGAQRHIVAGNNTLRYTTCHRKRGGLMPKMKKRA